MRRWFPVLLLAALLVFLGFSPPSANASPSSPQFVTQLGGSGALHAPLPTDVDAIAAVAAADLELQIRLGVKIKMLPTFDAQSVASPVGYLHDLLRREVAGPPARLNASAGAGYRQSLKRCGIDPRAVLLYG